MTALLFSLAILLIVALYGAIAVALVLGAAWLFDRLILWPIWNLKQRLWINRMIALGKSLRLETPK